MYVDVAGGCGYHQGHLVCGALLTWDTLVLCGRVFVEHDVVSDGAVEHGALRASLLGALVASRVSAVHRGASRCIYLQRERADGAAHADPGRI